jgi:uncharacterized protein (DUF1501 family)
VAGIVRFLAGFEAWRQSVKGGFYGTQPSLTALDSDSNMVSQVDFRQVYMPIIDTWLGGVTSQQVLGYSASDNLVAIPFI